TVGVDLSRPSFAAAALASAILALSVFMLLFLALALVTSALRAADASGSTEYWLLVALLALGGTSMLYGVVCESLAFRGSPALIGSFSLAAGIAAAWATLAGLRSQIAGSAPLEPAAAIDAIELVVAPIAGRGSRVSAVMALAAAPLVATTGVDLLRHYDWNF